MRQLKRFHHDRVVLDQHDFCTDCGVLREACALDGVICLNDSMIKLKPKMECLYETKIARR